MCKAPERAEHMLIFCSKFPTSLSSTEIEAQVARVGIWVALDSSSAGNRVLPPRGLNGDGRGWRMRARSRMKERVGEVASSYRIQLRHAR